MWHVREASLARIQNAVTVFSQANKRSNYFFKKVLHAGINALNAEHLIPAVTLQRKVNDLDSDNHRTS